MKHLKRTKVEEDGERKEELKNENMADMLDFLLRGVRDVWPVRQIYDLFSFDITAFDYFVVRFNLTLLFTFICHRCFA